MRKFAGHVALLAMLATTACSTTDNPADRVSTRPLPAPGSSQSSAAYQPQPVKQPWTAGQRELGIAVYWENNPKDSDGVVRAKARKILDYVVSTGANSVAVAFSFVMASGRANAVIANDPTTPSPGRLAIVLEEANLRKLRTTIRPMLNERNLAKSSPTYWRGSIQPSNPAAWFTSYRKMLLSFATVAETYQLTTFIIGTELNSMERQPGWARVASDLRTVYHGQLGYSANHDRLKGPAPAAGVLKSIDAYPALQVSDSASVAQLAKGWNSWLNKAGTGPHKHLVLAEVAISANSKAYAMPWYWRPRGQIKPEIQQRWFDAACSVMRQRNLAGIYFWMINMDGDPKAKPTDKAPMEFVGRPSEANIRACFSLGSQR